MGDIMLDRIPLLCISNGHDHSLTYYHGGLLEEQWINEDGCDEQSFHDVTPEELKVILQLFIEKVV